MGFSFRFGLRVPFVDNILGRFPRRDHLNLDPEDEGGAHAQLRLHPHVAPRLLTNELTRVEAQSLTADILFLLSVDRLVEAIKDLVLLFTTDANSVIFDGHFDGGFFDLLVRDVRLNRHRLVVVAVLDGILEEIAEHLGKAAPIVLEIRRLHLIVVECLNLYVLFLGLWFD